jgi:phage pi2 protein 07
MQNTITIEPTIKVELPPDKVLIDRAEYNDLREAAAPLTWIATDCIKQLHGIRRSRFDSVIAAHHDELVAAGAIWQEGAGRRPTKYRVSIMRNWLNQHLEEFASKGES